MHWLIIGLGLVVLWTTFAVLLFLRGTRDPKNPEPPDEDDDPDD